MARCCAPDGMLCGPWYYGPGDEHVPNNQARVLGVQDNEFVDGPCLDIAALPSNNLDQIREDEAAIGIG